MAEALIPVTLVCDTSILADGDIISNPVEMPGAIASLGKRALLQSVSVLDEDDQGVAMDLVFLRSNVSLGTLNAAPSITDANAREIQARVRIAAGDFIDFGGSRHAVLGNLGIMLEPASGTSMFVGAITRGGTPTYTASGLRLQVGILHL